MEVLCGRISGLRLLGHRMHDDRLEIAWHPGLDRTRQSGRFRHVLVGDRHGRVGGERRTACHHLVEHDTKRIDIAAAVHAESLSLLGREVRGRSHHQTGLGDALARADRPRYAEVGNLHLAIGGYEDVAGLHVAVDHTMAMRVTEGFRDIGCNCRRSRRRQWRLGADDRGQRLAVHVLHDDVISTVGFAPVKDRDDVRVRQVRGGLCLPPETLDERVVRRQLREEHLQGDRAIEQQVMGQIDLSRPTTCDLAAQLVAAVVDRRRGLGHRRGQPIRRPDPSGRTVGGQGAAHCCIARAFCITAATTGPAIWAPVTSLARGSRRDRNDRRDCDGRRLAGTGRCGRYEPVVGAATEPIDLCCAGLRGHGWEQVGGEHPVCRARRVLSDTQHQLADGLRGL